MYSIVLTCWVLGLFGKNLDVLEVFQLDIGSFNLVKKAFATWQLAFLSTSIASYDILARACAEIKRF